jgi:hypothetical protein
VHASIHTLIHPSIRAPPIHTTTDPPIAFIYARIHPSTHPSTPFIHARMSIHHPSMRHPFTRPLHPLIHASIHAWIHPSTSIHANVHPFIHASIHSSIHSSVHPSHQSQLVCRYVDVVYIYYINMKFKYIYICRALEYWGLCGLLTLASFFVRDRSQADPFAKSLSVTAFQGGGVGAEGH